MSQERTWFGVRVVIECRIAGEPDGTLEDRILLVHAPTYEDACARAEELVRDTSASYLNGDDEKVEWVFREVLNACWIQDPEPSDGTEVYSTFITEEELERLRKAP